MTSDQKPKQADIAPLGLRMPEELKERIKGIAEKQGRSMNAEIVTALEKAYPPPPSLNIEMLAMFLEGLAGIGMEEKEYADYVEYVNDVLSKTKYPFMVTARQDGAVTFLPFPSPAPDDSLNKDRDDK